MATETEIAWAQGLFEGEGCATFGRYGATPGAIQPRLAVEMADEEIVRRFHEVVGVGRVYSKNARQEAHRPTWIWVATAHADVLAALDILQPGLGSRRQEQIRPVREWTTARIAAKGVCIRGHRIEGENRSSDGHCLRCGRDRARVKRAKARL